MRAKGINYDTGFINKRVSSRERFDIAVVTRELQIIRDDLHCNAVRVTGGDVERLEIAAGIAAEAGLEVWFSPFTCDLTYEEMLDLLADCAERAERLRRQGAEVVLVVGAEISLLNKGFLPGDTIGERMELLADLHRLRALIAEIPGRVNDFLRSTPTGRSRSPTGSPPASVRLWRRANLSRSPSLVRPPTKVRPTRALVAGRSSSGTRMPSERFG